MNITLYVILLIIVYCLILLYIVKNKKTTIINIFFKHNNKKTMETSIKSGKKQKVEIVATDSIGNESALSFSDLSMLQSNNKEVCDIEQDGDNFLIIAKSNGSTQIVGQYVNEQGLTLTTSLDVIVLDSSVTIVSISFKIGDIID